MNKISILTVSDFPDGRAPENFVREMVKGIATITGVPAKKVKENINWLRERI